MAHWILQANPSHWRIHDFFADGRTGTTWTVRRHRDRIGPGADVAIWLSGRGGGVVAFGRITGAPRFGVAEGDDERYWTGAAERDSDHWFVPVLFTRHFLDQPIPRDVLRDDPRFADAAILRAPSGGNPFPLDPAGWAAVVERVPHRPTEHRLVATTVRTAAAVVAAGATAVREAIRAAVN